MRAPAASAAWRVDGNIAARVNHRRLVAVLVGDEVRLVPQPVEEELLDEHNTRSFRNSGGIASVRGGWRLKPRLRDTLPRIRKARLRGLDIRKMFPFKMESIGRMMLALVSNVGADGWQRIRADRHRPISALPLEKCA